jgi:hypothetical protein
MFRPQHPSGRTSPSPEISAEPADGSCARLMEMSVVDHLIVGRDGEFFVSGQGTCTFMRKTFSALQREANEIWLKHCMRRLMLILISLQPLDTWSSTVSVVRAFDPSTE